MRNCSFTLTQVGRQADFNCTVNLFRLVRRLPKAIQVKWVRIAESLSSLRRDVTFEDFLGLIQRLVSIAHTEYGLIASERSGTSVAA